MSGCCFGLKTVLFAFFGFLICFSIMIGPEIAAKNHVQKGYVWAPVTSANTTAGDSFYYAAWIREVIASGPTMKPPTVPVDEARPSIEFFKMAPMTFAAAPYLLTHDIGWTVVISRYLFIAAIFLIAFYWSRITIPNSACAFIIGIWFVFYYDFLVLGAASGGDVGAMFEGLMVRYKDFFDVDYVMDRYRMVNPGVVTFITLLYFSALVATLRKPCVLTSAAGVLLGMVMAFNYPPHTMMGYLTLFFLFTVTALQRHYKAAAHFIGQGLLIVLFLLLIDFRGLYQNAMAHTDFLGDIFLISVFKDSPFNLSVFFETMFSTAQKTNLIICHILSWVFAFAVFRKNAVWRSFLIAFGLLQLTFMMALGFYDNVHIVGRLFIRGIDTIWGLPFSIAIAYLLYGFYKTRMMSGTKIAPVMMKICGAVIAIYLLYAPTKGAIHFAGRSHTLRQVQSAQMEAYNWMQSNLPAQSVVMAASWEDVYMIPVYTDLNLFYGHWILDNRTVEDELDRYLLSKKFLGEPHEKTISKFESSLADYDLYAKASSGRDEKGWITPPFVKDHVFESALTAHGLFYWPYVPTYKGLPLQDARKEGAINPAVLRDIEKDYARLSMDKDWQAKFDYILVPRQSGIVFKAQGYKEIFANSYARVYGKI